MDNKLASVPQGEWHSFLAVSYGAACESSKERMPGYRKLLEEIVWAFETRSQRIYLAPREEQWGKARPSRKAGIKRDIVALQCAKAFLIFLGGNESDGALVELGMAVAMEKNVWILRRRCEILPSYFRGLVGGRVRIYTIGSGDDVERLAEEVAFRCNKELGDEDPA